MNMMQLKYVPMGVRRAKDGERERYNKIHKNYFYLNTYENLSEWTHNNNKNKSRMIMTIIEEEKCRKQSSPLKMREKREMEMVEKNMWVKWKGFMKRQNIFRHISSSSYVSESLMNERNVQNYGWKVETWVMFM